MILSFIMYAQHVLFYDTHTLHIIRVIDIILQPIQIDRNLNKPPSSHKRLRQRLPIASEASHCALTERTLYLGTSFSRGFAKRAHGSAARHVVNTLRKIGSAELTIFTLERPTGESTGESTRSTKHTQLAKNTKSGVHNLPSSPEDTPKTSLWLILRRKQLGTFLAGRTEHPRQDKWTVVALGCTASSWDAAKQLDLGYANLYTGAESPG
ncbi:uncharacterized protein V1513DRAFT_221610 [Lipomyces chichibuensis]|uniref:uncharacterized protein n=1 Tax=Lipomyces chichibuensis TaxID=1546026 RepID=UPI003343C001